MKKQTIYFILVLIALIALFIVTISVVMGNKPVQSENTEHLGRADDTETQNQSIGKNTETELDVFIEENDTSVMVSVEDMPLDEYLSTYGLKTYESEYLTLKPIENVFYVPQAYGIQIYYSKMYVGEINILNMVMANWTGDEQLMKSKIGGARSIFEQVTLTETLHIPYLVRMFYHNNEMFGTPRDQEGILGHEQFLSEEDIENIKDTCTYEILYGSDSSKYAYKMTLSAYFMNENILEQIISGVQLNEQSFSEAAYQNMSFPADISGTPDSVLKNGDVKFPDNSDTAELDYSFAFGVGNVIYRVPEGTVAVVSKNGWNLYAFVSSNMSEIGTINLYNVSLDDKSSEQIAKEYLGDNYQRGCLEDTDTGFEYHYVENNVAVDCIYSKNDNMLLVAEYAVFE